MLKTTEFPKDFKVTDHKDSITFFSSKYYFVEYFPDGVGAIKCISNPSKIIQFVSPCKLEESFILFDNIA